MSENENKTEQATPHKLQKARRDGDVPRSKELANAVVMSSLITGCLIFFGALASTFSLIFFHSFSASAYIGDTPPYLPGLLNKISYLTLAFAVWILAHTYVGTILLGGAIFSMKKVKPKMENLSWKKGLKKVISTQNVFETVKAALKLAVIGTISYFYLMENFFSYIMVRWSSKQAMLNTISQSVLIYLAIMTIVLVAFSLIDIPVQIKTFKKKMMMSHKEVKDEYKQTEGNPEVKGKMKQKQREASERRHIPETSKATVVITNPTHYSVAILFDQATQDAPKVVSMGKDNNAFRIREVATNSEIPVVSIPPLARALYHEAEIGRPIPYSLYEPVAALLAYILGLDDVMAHDVSQISDTLSVPEKYLSAE